MNITNADQTSRKKMTKTYDLYAKRLFLHLVQTEAKAEWHKEHEEFLKLGQRVVPILIDFVQSWRDDKRQKLKKWGISIEDVNPNQIRGGAIQMLGELRDERAFDVIVKELKKRKTLLTNSLTALSFYKANKKAFQLIVPHLKFKESGVREVAAYALGRLGDTEAIPHLEEFVRNEPEAYMKDVGQRAIIWIKTGRLVLKGEGE